MSRQLQHKKWKLGYYLRLQHRATVANERNERKNGEGDALPGKAETSRERYKYVIHIRSKRFKSITNRQQTLSLTKN